MATVEGIDKLGQSLLSQSFSKRKQLRDDVKKQQKRARNVALVGGALRFVDGIVRDQHANWFEGEANRNATRFLKQHQTYLTERQKYLDDVRDSGKSAEDYEIDLLRTFLPEEKLKSRLPSGTDISDKDWITFLEGSDTKDGFYRSYAKERVAARDQWGKNLASMPDPVTAMQNWQKVNPRSRNLMHGAFKFLKDKFSGSVEGNSQQLLNDSLAEIKSNSAKLEDFYAARTAGFSEEDAIKRIKTQINLSSTEKKGTKVGEAKEVTDNIIVPDGQGGFANTTVSYFVQTWERSDKSIWREMIPLAEGNGTKEQIDASKKFVYKKVAPIISKYERTNPRTGLKETFQDARFYDADKNLLPHSIIKKNITDKQTQDIINNPTGSDLVAGRAKIGFNSLSSVWSSLHKFKDPKKDTDADEVDDYINSLVISPETPEKQYNEITTNMGIAFDRIEAQLQSSDYQSYTSALGFSRGDIQKIAGQLWVIDEYVYNENSKIPSDQTFKGNSADNVDPAKFILAIDLLRSRGQLGTDRNGNTITNKALQERLATSGFFKEYAAAFSKNESQGQDEGKYFTDSEIATIKEFKNQIQTNLQGTGDYRQSLLEMRLEFTDPENTKVPLRGETESLTVYKLMTGNVLAPSSGTTDDNALTTPNPMGQRAGRSTVEDTDNVDINDIDKNDTTGLLNYLGGVVIEAANFFPSLRKSNIDDQLTTDDSLLDPKTTGFTLRKVKQFLKKDLYPEGYEPLSPEEIKVAGVGSKATQDFRVSRFRALEPLIPDAQARHDVIDNASRFLEAFETEEGAVNQIQLLKEKINLLDTTDMTLGAVNRRVKGIDIGILGISEDTARKIAGIDTAKKRGLFN